MYVLVQVYALFWMEGWLDLIQELAGATPHYLESFSNFNGRLLSISETVDSTHCTLYVLLSYMQGGDPSREPPQIFDQVPVPTDSPPQQSHIASNTLSSVSTLAQFAKKNSNKHATTRTLAPPARLRLQSCEGDRCIGT